MKITSWMAGVALGLMLSACGGGGGNAGTSPFDPDSGPSGSETPVAADLSLVLSSSSVDNSGSQTVLATVTAVDAARNTLKDIPVTMTVDNNATLSPSGTVTTANGTLTGSVSIGADRSNRLVTVTATSGALQRTATFRVIGAKVEATLVPAVVNPSSTGNKIQYRLTDVNSNAMAGQAITVSAPNVADVAGTTDANGSYEYVYTAPATAGNWDVTASAGGVTSVSTVLVQPVGGGAIPAATGTIRSASVSANPSVVSVNTADTSNRSEIRALFVGADNAPIVNVRARFSLPDPNGIGGTLTTGSNVVYSDANGVATSAYVPGSRSSPTNGVVVRVCYDNADFAVGACPNQRDVTLTVISEALGVTIGTDNTISEGTSGLTYVKRFVVLVVDASGQAKAGVQLTPSLDLVEYVKGYYDGPSNWNRSAPSVDNPVPVAGTIGFTGSTCPNEDLNRNGILETGEDLNGNGKLEPRKPDATIRFVGSNVTDASGTAVLQIEYPKNVATWVRYEILVSASGVSGTEGRDTWTGILAADAGSFKAEIAPAFVESPYGVSSQLPAGMLVNPSGGTVADGCYNPN